MQNILKLDKNQVHPYYQGQFNTFKELIGAEILMRFKHNNTAAVISYLEFAKSIHQLDLYAIECAIKWHQKCNLPCSANLSGLTFGREGIVSIIREITQGIDIEKIKLELTEGNNLTLAAINNIQELNSLGYTISLDDYGSEYNSLNRLLVLPFAELKIDRLLITNLNNIIPNKAVSLVYHALELARELNIQVIAEGVETKDQFNLLVDLGCDRFQGYLFGKPERFIL